METSYDDHATSIDEQDDPEFNRVASIYFNVNLIQKSFRALKTVWSQSKRGKA